jgi:hypothetical protein
LIGHLLRQVLHLRPCRERLGGLRPHERGDQALGWHVPYTGRLGSGHERGILGLVQMIDERQAEEARFLVLHRCAVLDQRFEIAIEMIDRSVNAPRAHVRA